MGPIDATAAAVNAAGIADAMRALQPSGEASESRLAQLTDEFNGWIGVLIQIAEAGAIMEQYRTQQGATSAWGGDLPYLYEVWDAIAEAMWQRLDTEPIEELTLTAITSVVENESAPAPRPAS